MESNTDYLQPQNSTSDDIQSLQSIYRQISVNFNEHFDEIDENNQLYKYIDDCFSIDFKHIESEKLINDITLFNTKLVEFIKYCMSKKFTEVDIIFIIFCDYFDLPYNTMFCKLHQKIKTTILNKYISYVGEDEYQEQKAKYEEPKDYIQPTLFDLLK